VAYDLVADDEGEAIGLPWRARRERLERFARERGPKASFVVNPVAPLAVSKEELAIKLDQEFAAARNRGHEGLVLKRIDSPYDADSIEAVEGLFGAQVETGHREEDASAANDPSRSRAEKGRAKKRVVRSAAGQLTLFGDDDRDS